MKNRKFFAGLEEVFARFLALFVSLVFFAVYVSAKSEVTLDWYSLVGYLSLFWLIYELLSYIFFRAFMFFSRDDENPLPSNESTIDIASTQE
jgi:hypothetical protein